MAALSLERVKAASLAIELQVAALVNSPKLVGFIDLLLPHIQNITSLFVGTFYTIGELTKALPNFPNSMPNLRSLTLRGGGIPDWSQRTDPPRLFCSSYVKGPFATQLPPIPFDPQPQKFSLVDYHFNLHLDALLDFLEQNRSLENARLWIGFVKPSLRHSQRQTPIEN